jgi:hypothetical protein
MKSLLFTKTKMSVYKQIATILNAGQYTQKRNRYCAPHMISKPMGSFSMYTLPRRLREMRELSLVVSKPLDKVTGYALTEQGVKLAKSK